MLQPYHRILVIAGIVFCLPLPVYAYSGECSLKTDNQAATTFDWQQLINTPSDWNKHSIITAGVNWQGITPTPIGNLGNSFASVFDSNSHIIHKAIIGTNARYLMSSHCTIDQKLYLWDSNDGLSWRLLNGGPSYSAPSGVIRDPSIFKHTDGRYYVCYTNNNTGDPCHPGRSNRFGVASSPDLAHWSFVRWVYLCHDSVHTVWAPEWFVNDDGHVHVFVMFDYNIYETHPIDPAFAIWSTPVKVSGELSGAIDPYLVKLNGRYYLWFSRDSYIGYSSSSSLTGPYTVKEANDWAGWGHKEGECLQQLGGGRWRIYFEPVLGAVQYSESNDNWATWTTPVAIASDQNNLSVAHGTVIKLGN
jgi:hypothetical protein